MAEAPSGDKTLTPNDAVDVLEELLEVQAQSYAFGLKLKLPQPVVNSIHSTNTQPRDCLLQVIIAFTQQVDNPTWRAIIDALRSPTLNLLPLANKVEAVHFPDPTSTRDVVPEIPSTATHVQYEAITDVSQDATTENTLVSASVAPAQTTTTTSIPSQIATGDVLHTTVTETVQPQSPKPGSVSRPYVEAKIRKFEKRFNGLKKATRECLERRGIAVKSVADALTSLPADDVDEHKQFLESHVSALYQAQDHSELFGTMNFNWNYLSYQLLEHLIQVFDLDKVKGEMKAYKKELQQFRAKIPFTLFCQTQTRRWLKLEPAFREVVAEFDWPAEVMLEDVEQFRQEYAYHYSLRECAMMLAEVRPGSFIVTWFIPESIDEKLRTKVPRAIFKKYSVIELRIAGKCVYRVSKNQIPTKIASSSSDPSTATSEAATERTKPSEGRAALVSHSPPSTEQEYLFVVQPSKDFFCPVTCGLLLQPHLTECCGNHFSQEAVARIQREGKSCPMCNSAPFNTMLNKQFLRQVNELRVFCHHEDRGCEWQGELSALEGHISSCRVGDTLPMTDLSEHPEYCEDTHSQFASYTYQVSGTGLHSATANHPTHVLVELSDSSGRPCSLQQNVTAELELISKATPTSPSCKTCLLVAMMSPSQYKVSYTAVSRGQHKLHVQVNNREINGSPFTITVYPDPTQLGCPVRVVTGLNHPYGIAFNSRGEMIISESNGHQISIFDIRGKKIRPFGSHGDSPEQMIQPRGIAIDDANNIYVSSEHKLQKFTSSGELIMCVGQKGNKEGAEFYYPRGVTLHNNQLYVCDRDNHRIQVFDLDLNFIQPISVCGRGGDKVKDPYDVKFDSAGNMYIADYGNERVQVMDINGRFIRAFGQEGKEKLKGPSAVHIVGTYVYVPDHSGLCIVVYDTSGQFVTSFGERGNKEGQFRYPRCITSCADGFIYVCDSGNGRVQIF